PHRRARGSTRGEVRGGPSAAPQHPVEEPGGLRFVAPARQTLGVPRLQTAVDEPGDELAGRQIRPAAGVHQIPNTTQGYTSPTAVATPAPSSAPPAPIWMVPCPACPGFQLARRAMF